MSTSRLAAFGFIALLLTAAHLVAAPSRSLAYFASVGLHPLLGLVLVGALVREAWRRPWRGNLPAAAGVGLLAAGLALGLAVAAVGATRDHAWLLQVHVAVSTAGAILWGVHLWRAIEWTPGWARAARIALVAAAVAGLSAPLLRAARDAEWRETHRIENPVRPPATMDEEGAGASSPFAPSSATTNTGDTIPADFFLTSETCGRCHADIYEQWNASAHHFSSFNNQWYRRSIEYMQEVVGTRPSKWCAGCHDHAVFFNGRFDTPIVEQIDTPEAQAGLGCTSCHSIVHVGSTMGQGDFTIEYPPLHDLAASEHPLLRSVHDLLLRLAPKPHRDTFMKPVHTEQSAEFCSSCHKVHLDLPVNDYRWVRGFNEYDNWQASGVSGQGARSFYYPETPQTCSSCHMPLVRSDDPAARDGYVRSHRFPGANTALPFVNRDQAQLEAVQDFLRAGQVSIDVFGITRVAEAAAPAGAVLPGGDPALSSTFAVGEESLQFGAGRRLPGGPAPAEVVAPLDLSPVAVRRGESVRLEVVVRTRNVGHFFPGGTVDAFDVWVELEAVDDRGRVLLHSGEAADGGSGPVDPGAHFYRSLQLDEHGNPINKRNAWATRVGRLRAADSPRRCRHRPLPARDSRGRRRPHHPAREGQLPEVRLVVHPVGVRRGPRSVRPGTVGRERPRRRAVGVHRRHERGVGTGEGDSGHSYHGDGRGHRGPDRRRRGRAPLARAGGPPPATPGSADAGTTTASGCSCRATYGGRRRRSAG